MNAITGYKVCYQSLQDIYHETAGSAIKGKAITDYEVCYHDFRGLLQFFHIFKVVSSTIVQAEDFYDGERLHFPRDDLVGWFDGDRPSFAFKVRPLHYPQKIKDFEIFAQKQLAELDDESDDAE